MYIGTDYHKTTTSIYIVLGMTSTIVCHVWDVYMDWGLMRSFDEETRYLRPKLLYPKYFYYQAMISNFVMRMFWILPVYFDSDFMKQTQIIYIVLGLVEAFRRTQWTLLRIENENVNNFEMYRNILTIPNFKDEEEDMQQEKLKERT